jgi:hypothetical protein
VTSLSQHSPKNKTAQQFDLFEAAPTDDAASIAAPATLAGLAVKLERDRCKCGSDTAIIGDGKAMHRASLSCRSCGRFRGWLSRFTADWIEAVINLHGRPDEPIILREPKP